MTAEEDARQDVLDAVERLRGPASLLPPVRVQRQFEFDQLLDVFSETVADVAYRGGCDDTKDDAFKEGKDEGLDEGRQEGHNEGYDEGYDEGKEDGLKEGRNEGYDTGFEAGKSAGYAEAEADLG